jgi:hypothetical protein
MIRIVPPYFGQTNGNTWSISKARASGHCGGDRPARQAMATEPAGTVVPTGASRLLRAPRAATLENRCFDEINIGDTASIKRTLTVRDVQLFATVSGDVNPTHLDLELVKQLGAKELSAHSMWLGAQISGLLGNELPGPGTVYAGQDLEFHAPLALARRSRSASRHEKNLPRRAK